MGFFKKRPKINVDKASCCDDLFGLDCSSFVESFVYDENTFDLTLNTACGNTLTVSLASLAPDGVVIAVSFDPITSILTVETSAPSIFQVPITQPLVVENTLFVMEAPTGNDGTGTRERLDLPFASLNAARAAAQAGDNIVVFAGEYVNPNPVSANNILAQDELSYFCYPGTVIRWTSQAGFFSAFWDQGLPTTFEFKGYADLVFENGPFPGESRWLSHPDSDYVVECNSITTRQRMFCYGGTRLYIKCREEFRALWGQLFDLRLAPNTNMDFKLEAPVLFADNTAAGTDTDYSVWGVRNLGEGGSVEIKGRVKYYDSFFSTGLIYHERIRGLVKYDLVFDYVGFNQSNGVYAYNDRTKNVMVSLFDEATYNIRIELLNHYGQFIAFRNAVNNSIGRSKGKIEVVGRMVIPSAVWVGSYNTLFGLAADSRLRIEMDLAVRNENNNVGNPSVVNFLDVGRSSNNVYVSGRLIHDNANNNIRRPLAVRFNTNFFPSAVLRDLVIEVINPLLDPNGLMYSQTGGALQFIKCKSVYSNVGLDPADLAAVIEPVTVSPTVKA